MSYVVTLEDFIPPKRTDGVPWNRGRVEESGSSAGPWTPIQTLTLSPLDSDPAKPADRDLTTNQATMLGGFYRVVFLDAAGGESAPSGAVSTVPAAPTDLYTSVTEVRLALAPDGDPSDEGSAAEFDDGQLADAIRDAQTEVDARIGGNRFTLGTVPELVQNVTRDIAAYLATLTHRRGEPVDPNDPVQKRYDRALAILKDVQAGRIELWGEPDATAEAFVQNVYEGELFTLDDLRLGIDGRRRGHMPEVALDGWDDGMW